MSSTTLLGGGEGGGRVRGSEMTGVRKKSKKESVRERGRARATMREGGRKGGRKKSLIAYLWMDPGNR